MSTLQIIVLMLCWPIALFGFVGLSIFLFRAVRSIRREKRNSKVFSALNREHRLAEYCED